ncbi:hypothetical protein GCM10010918_49220 [Paenibacillus radicis (ex Gao et al. 2016)]|uniref:Uncharacterized protein n=2 Tax=Paenibacillus radicis (ex Gao et al. 2016) TaxID=1737354 RepID=A0A917HNL4_9BACL|nr:hypothetical protein GCM10010918_49220 [Paenibacillus radicis (ex Gao et al. 2016)]
MLQLKLHTLDDVKQGMQQVSIQGAETEMLESYRLTSARDSAAYAFDNGELLYVYEFEAPTEAHEGMKKIEEQTALVDLVYSPVIYNANNVILIYMQKYGETTGKQPAVEKLASSLGWQVSTS